MSLSIKNLLESTSLTNKEKIERLKFEKKILTSMDSGYFENNPMFNGMDNH
jgi:hypothetical protein